jgi:UDP-glucose 4-epimerase
LAERVLITGAASPWGARLVQSLEPEAEVIAVDDRDPPVAFERAEFVRMGRGLAQLRRLVRAAAVDALVDARPGADAAALAACAEGSPVRRLVFQSTADYYGYDAKAPAFLTEDTPPATASSPAERAVRRAEAAVAELARARPELGVVVLRCAEILAPGGPRGPLQRLLELPVVPAVLGYDPRCQFIAAEDVAGALEHAIRSPELDGAYNAAADGVLALSEAAGLLGHPLAPALPPLGTGLLAAPLSRLGLTSAPELLGALRRGRGLDNRRLKASGYAFRLTSREAVLELRERRRAARLAAGEEAPYVYEREVEEFLRRSPSVHRGPARPAPAPAAPPPPKRPPRRRPRPYADLEAADVIASLAELTPAALRALRRHEQGTSARDEVLRAIDERL